MTISKNGVAYNLAESPYTYQWDNYMFFFSSIYHKRKFVEELTIKREWLNDSMTRRFKSRVYADVLAVLNFYRQVETRGYYVVDVYGREYTSPEQFIIKVGVDDAI